MKFTQERGKGENDDACPNEDPFDFAIRKKIDQKWKQRYRKQTLGSKKLRIPIIVGYNLSVMYMYMHATADARNIKTWLLERKLANKLAKWQEPSRSGVNSYSLVKLSISYTQTANKTLSKIATRSVSTT